MEKLSQATDLSLFLGAFDRATFFAHHWERRSLHLAHHDPGRFAHLIDHESFFEREVARCGHLKASSRDSQGWNQEIVIQPEQALKMFKAGMTICATRLDEKGPCGEVLEAYRRGVTSAAPQHVNCYYSPDKRGYGLHFDTHPVWILQVAGSKHWTVSHEPAVRNPPFNVVFPPDRDFLKLPWISLYRPDLTDGESFMHVRLDPGDVLYIPAGGWHAARAEGASLALTLAMGRVGAADLFESLVSQSIVHRLRDLTSRLAPLPKPHLAPAGEQRAELAGQLEESLARLKGLVQSIGVEDLLRMYDFCAEHPEVLDTGRSFLGARDQVQAMKALYPST